MIDIKTLRIGSCIIDPKYPTLISFIEQLHSEYAVSSYSDSISYDEMSPIKFNPYLLYKLGFVGDPNKYAECGFIFTLEYLHNPKAGAFLDKLKFTSQTGIYVKIVGLNWVKCHYLHEFQTLYFALTNKELNVQECDATDL